MIEVYHVKASSGSYEGYHEWTVISFLKEEDAQKYLELHCNEKVVKGEKTKHQDAFEFSYYVKKGTENNYEPESWEIVQDYAYESWQEMEKDLQEVNDGQEE